MDGKQTVRVVLATRVLHDGVLHHSGAELVLGAEAAAQLVACGSAQLAPAVDVAPAAHEPATLATEEAMANRLGSKHAAKRGQAAAP